MKIAWIGLSLMSVAIAGPKLDFARGVLEDRRGNDGGEWFGRALAGDPDAWPLVRRVAARRFHDGDVAGASTLYREFVAARPRHLEARIAYANFLRDSSPRDDFAAKLAAETLEDGLRHHPDNLSLIRLLFFSHEQRGEREQSRQLFDRLAESGGPDHVLAAAEMARTLFSADDDAARARLDELFEQALVRRPQNARLARAASEHFRTSGRLPEAIEILEHHTQADPASLALRVRLGILKLAAGQSDEATATLKDVLEIDPNRTLAHQTLAKYYRSQEQPDRARPHAIALLKLRSGDADEFVALAEELLADDQPREARLLLEKGLFDHPRHASIAVKLAIATRRDPSTPNLTVQRFREAEALSGSDGPATAADFQREFAECLLEADRPEAAEARLRAAIKAYPPEATRETAASLRRLADLWLEDGRNQAAARALHARADTLDPRD